MLTKVVLFVFDWIDDERFATLAERLIKDDVIVSKNGKLVLARDD